MKDKNINKKKKNKSKILATAIVIALLIVIGGTFAWFSSSDEVTNRLSAEQNYGVSITETYTPVENMIPGTEVEKKVGAVNTGNVDAFVKMSVSGQLELTTLDATGDTSLGSDTSIYFDVTAEKTALQAGAILAYTSNTSETATLGSLVSSNGTSFTPQGAGFYVFARSVNASTDGNTWEYTGYYYDGSQYYYAITIGDRTSSTINSDGTITGTAPTLTIDKKTTNVISTDSGLTFNYDNLTSGYITVTYDPTTNDTSSGDEIIFKINLAESYTDNKSTYWTYDSTGNEFYYNYILASSATTASNLITSVELDDTVKESAYVSLNFDLNIGLKSIQVSGDTTDLGEAVNADTTWWYVYGDASGSNVTSNTTTLTWQSAAYTNP